MNALAFRLSIAPALETFRPEIVHACDFLARCHGLIRDETAPRILHYGPAPPEGAVYVPAALFPSGARLDGEGIHPVASALDDMLAGKRETALFPKTTGRLDYDALGLIFLLLSRIEERGHQARDRYGRFPYAASLAVRKTGKAANLADDAARDIAAAMYGTDTPPIATRHQILVTHDVDRLKGYHRAHEPLRHALGDLAKRGAPGKAWHRLVDGYFSREPWRSARALMAASEARGLASRFYFMGPSAHPMDSPYTARMPKLLGALGREIAARGHVVGFHPGFETASDPALWQAQRAGLENALGFRVTEGRQHVLRYIAEDTPDIWNDAGMALDATLAWPDASGFRSGTCRRHAAYSLRRRCSLALDQVSTAIMDFSFFGGKYRAIEIDDALDEARKVAKICKHHGGALVILQHTGQNRPPQSAFFERLLDLAS